MPDSSLPLVAGWAALAALAAALGAFLPAGQGTSGSRPLAVASALAAGAMLGVGYPLMSLGLARGGVAATLGALAGVAAPWATHVLLGVGGGDPAARTGRAVAAGALHSAPEGIAIGAAMAVGTRFGLFLVATLAIHNVWEVEVLSARLRAAGRSRGRAALLGILTNLPQPAFAVLAFALARAVPASLPPLLGLGFGALTYLALAELLPESYEAAGRTSIAVVVSVAAGVVALLGGSV